MFNGNVSYLQGEWQILRAVPGRQPDPAQFPGAAKVKHISKLYSAQGVLGGKCEDK